MTALPRTSWKPASADGPRCCALAAATLGPRLAQLTDAARRTLATSDPEGVHDTRVACRRMRSALRAFRGCLDPSAAELAAALRELGGLLGPARDAEVRLDRLAEVLPPLAVAVDRSDELTPSAGRHALVVQRPSGAARPDRRGQDAAAQRHLLDRAHEAEAAARGRALASLPALLPLVERAPAVRPGHRDAGAATRLARRQLQAPFHRAATYGAEEPAAGAAAAAPPQRPSDAALHRRRIAIKRLRYGLECFAPILPRVHRGCLGQLRGLQDGLGHHHDLVVLAAWVHAEGREADPTLRPALRRLEVRIAHAGREVADRAVDDLARLDAAGYWPSARVACLRPLRG